MQPGQPERYDYEYVRHGTTNTFMFFAPLLSWRHLKVTAQRTRIDWAEAMREVIDVYFPDAETVVVVMDNLNTHGPASFYEAFEPKLARQYVRRLEFCYTPKHGSWLNVAECELSCLTSQCLRGRRIGDLEFLQTEIRAWSGKTNAKQRGVDWQFKIDDARSKLKRLYPKPKT